MSDWLQELERAKRALELGAITDEEFDVIKGKARAAMGFGALPPSSLSKGKTPMEISSQPSGALAGKTSVGPLSAYPYPPTFLRTHESK